MSAESETLLTVVQSIEEIPSFNSEEEEHTYWETHEFSGELWDQADPSALDDLPPSRAATKAVAIHFDEFTLSRLMALARTRHKGYQTLLKEFVTERLYEEEKRDGILSGMWPSGTA